MRVSKQHALYVDHMGTDLSVVKAAKVSFADDSEVQHFITDIEAKGLGCRSHAALIRYLAKHYHWTPFSHTAITLRMRAPLPIRTQCFKHKVGFVENEESRRYISSEPTFHVPDVFRGVPTEGAKQGSSGPLSVPLQAAMTETFTMHNQVCLSAYNKALSTGVCPEQARLLLPQGTNVNWYWTGNLAAFSRFYTQRTDPHAQKEIAELAEEVATILTELYPISWAALTTHL